MATENTPLILPGPLVPENAACESKATIPLSRVLTQPYEDPHNESGELAVAVLSANTTDPVSSIDMQHGNVQSSPLIPVLTQIAEQEERQRIDPESIIEKASDRQAPVSGKPDDVDLEQQGSSGQGPAKPAEVRDPRTSTTFNASLSLATYSNAAGDILLNHVYQATDVEMLFTPGVANPEEAEFEIDSSPIESSSSESTSDSSSLEDSDDDYEMLDPEEQARRLMQEDGDGGSDEEHGKKGTAHGPLRTLNEIPDEDVPIPDVEIASEMKLEELGCVETIVGNVILIKGKVSGEYQVLETGSVLCLEDRVVIGVIAETLGRVQQPLYSVQFRNAAAVAEIGITKSSRIYYVDNFSTFVFTQSLKAFKGSDASNIYDEEVGDDEMEFSDDEAEAAYKKNKNMQKQAKRQERIAPGNPSPHAFQKSKLYRERSEQASELNYDESGAPLRNESNGDGELYTPLARPANLHTMLPPRPITFEGRGGHGDSPRSGNRGRGGRNRGHGRYEKGGRVPETHRDRYSNGTNSTIQGRQRPSSYSPNTQTTPMPSLPSPCFIPTFNSADPQSPHASTFDHSQNHQYHQNYQPQSPQSHQPYGQRRLSQQGQYQSTFNLPPQMQQYQQPYSPSYPTQGQYSPQYAAYPPFPPSPSSSIPPGAFVNPAFFNNSFQAPISHRLPQPNPEHGSNIAFKAAQDRLNLLKQLSQDTNPLS